MRARIDEGASAAQLSLLASAVVVALWMVLQPRTADLAAQVYRTGLFERVGWVLWDNNWFGGHHLPGYSLFTPWLMAHMGIGVTGAAAAATTTLAFAAIVRAKGRGRWLWPTAWVAWAASGDLLIGRVTYSVGLALAVLAVLALVLEQPMLVGCVLGGLSAAASPVAGLFWRWRSPSGGPSSTGARCSRSSPAPPRWSARALCCSETAAPSPIRPALRRLP